MLKPINNEVYEALLIHPTTNLIDNHQHPTRGYWSKKTVLWINKHLPIFGKLNNSKEHLKRILNYEMVTT